MHSLLKRSARSQDLVFWILKQFLFKQKLKFGFARSLICNCYYIQRSCLKDRGSKFESVLLFQKKRHDTFHGSQTAGSNLKHEFDAPDGRFDCILGLEEPAFLFVSEAAGVTFSTTGVVPGTPAPTVAVTVH